LRQNGAKRGVRRHPAPRIRAGKNAHDWPKCMPQRR
jgi:hypothetical protein